MKAGIRFVGLEAMACLSFPFAEARRQQAIGDRLFAGVPVTYDKDRIADLVARATLDPAAWDALRKLLGFAVARGDPVPVPMRGWLLAFVAGSARRPRQHGQSRQKNLARDLGLVMAIGELVVEGRTANSVIPDVAGQFGVSVPVAEKVWQNYPRLHPDSEKFVE